MQNISCTSGNHTVAIVKGQESYELRKKSCSDILSQFNKLAESKKVNIDEKDIPVEVYVGGDYKVLELMSTLLAVIGPYCHK
jgi:hypothetical protein